MPSLAEHSKRIKFITSIKTNEQALLTLKNRGIDVEDENKVMEVMEELISHLNDRLFPSYIQAKFGLVL